MKKFFVFAAVAAFALVACNKEDAQTVKPGEGVVLNELSGAEKYIRVSADTTPEAIFFAKGDTITVKYQSADVDVNWINADTVEKTVAAAE